MGTGVCVSCNATDVEVNDDSEMCEDCMAEEGESDAPEMGGDTDDNE